MVKRQKEKQYLSAREQRDYQAIRSGGAAAAALGAASSSSCHLPFSHCALTLQPFVSPVCNERGIIFEKDALAGFVFKYKKDPVTGSPMSTRDMIVLKMTKEEDDDDDDKGTTTTRRRTTGGAWQCPVLQKNLGEHVKVVAIRQRDAENTANVYSYEAYEELNVKAKNYTDLTSGRPFDKKRDVLVLNDPQNETFNQLRDIGRFYHIQHERELRKDADASSSKEADSIRHSMTASRVLEKLKKKKAAATQQQQEQQQQQECGKRSARPEDTDDTTTTTRTTTNKRTKRSKVGMNLNGIVLAQDVTGVQYNTEHGASSFTSTGVSLAQDATARPATDEEILQAEFRVMTTKLKGRKGYVQMNLSVEPSSSSSNETTDEEARTTTTMTLTLELHCDIAPRTCANFLGLCAQEEYDGCTFHRLIPKFMIQGGGRKATGGDGEKDESLWGAPFVDEFDDRLTHTGPGIVSMANAGPGTNTRQFFVTFASCRHLDRKHSVFGKVVRGMEHLKTLEAIHTDKNDNPIRSITIVSMDVLENPAQIAHDMEEKRLQAILDARQKTKANPTNRHDNAKHKAAAAAPLKQQSQEESGADLGVGFYLKDRLLQKSDPKKSKNVPDPPSGTEPPVAVQRLPPPPKKTAYEDFSGW